MTLFCKIDKCFEIFVPIFEISHLLIEFSGSTFVVIYAINILHVLNPGQSEKNKLNFYFFAAFRNERVFKG